MKLVTKHFALFLGQQDKDYQSIGAGSESISFTTHQLRVVLKEVDSGTTSVTDDTFIFTSSQPHFVH